MGADGLIYAIGGVDQGYGTGHVTETVERFNESTQSWAYVASLVIDRYGLGSVTDSQGCIWAVGGANLSTFALSSVEVYDPAFNTWTAQSTGLNTARRCFGISITPDGCIFAYGGHGTGNVSLASVEKYDPDTGLWDYIASMNEGRVNHGFTSDSQGRLYAIGGQYYPTDKILKTVERYDPATNTWEYIAPLPKALSGAAAFTLNGEIWAVGGWEPYHLVNDCYIYSPDTDSWREGPEMYEDLVTARTAIGLSGLVYVIGGERSAGTPSNHVAILTPEPATLAILAMGGAWLVFRRHRTRTRTKGEAGMRNAAKKMAGLGVAVLMLAAAGVCQAAVTIDLSITADTGTKTWQVHATVTDPSNESLGLHGIGIDVWGSQTQYGPWTGGLSVNDGTDPLGEIVLPVGACPTYWWTIGFGAITVPGDVVGTGIELMGVLQPSVHQQRTISSVIYNSILKGAGETSGSAPVLGGDVSWAHPVLVAEGTYTGDFGWLNVSLYKDQAGKAVSVTVLPASLPAATTGGAPFATFSPMAGTNYRDSVFVPEPATLALVAVGIGAVVLRMRRG